MTSTPRVRMSPDSRREQLLDLGVRLLSTRSLDELSIEILAEEAGISRGLLYHYFGNKHDFHEAVVRRAADDLIEQTAPPVSGEPLERLLVSMGAYLDYVVANYEGYLSLVKGAASGSDTIRDIYEQARAVLTDRLFQEDSEGLVLQDSPTMRLVVHAWSAYAEDVALAWARDPAGVSRDEVLAVLADSLPALAGTVTRS
ncbi:TetR/AcrR family transcriptional regulator [Nocardioides sp. JQ2195]|uniref:TetR/AcrR family transcriptional regulator n=1 Tax=Nocardioides sp. JQ2195 TaxID=2592334 RepID=UPI00143E2B11|nr:TetR/AcrR family transcriptional regulator [Nocardioides sp. JQ2195]QIX27893.1 TetR/AcrR family transcriptional regulator [Nocardioides sp. JQ2195]